MTWAERTSPVKVGDRVNVKNLSSVIERGVMDRD